MGPNADDTVIVQRPAAASATGAAAAPNEARRLRGMTAAGLGVVAVVALAGAGFWLLRSGTPAGPASADQVPVVQTPAPPMAPVPAMVEAIPLASEAAIAAGSPAVRTLLRFAPNPAIVVLDFPTLAEQGRMLNRLAAWAEKGGVPHDRLLTDVELGAAIRASGTTPETYYYGHDYRGADVARFFTLADRDHQLLLPDEEELRRVMTRAMAEPAGFGALITLVRADQVQGVTQRMRTTVLHHELSHGQYFTDPSYATFVDTVWQGMLTPGERASFRTYLAAEGYDPALEDLMRNEMQAYLMHTPDAQFFDPDRLGIPGVRLQQLRNSFLAGMPPNWLKAECARLLPELPVPAAASVPELAASSHGSAPGGGGGQAARPVTPVRARPRRRLSGRAWPLPCRRAGRRRPRCRHGDAGHRSPYEGC